MWRVENTWVKKGAKHMEFASLRCCYIGEYVTVSCGLHLGNGTHGNNTQLPIFCIMQTHGSHWGNYGVNEIKLLSFVKLMKWMQTMGKWTIAISSGFLDSNCHLGSINRSRRTQKKGPWSHIQCSSLNNFNFQSPALRLFFCISHIQHLHRCNLHVFAMVF